MTFSVCLIAMFVIGAWAAEPMSAGHEVTNDVLTWTATMQDALAAGDTDTFINFFDEDSVVVADTMLPFGGTFKGNEIATHFLRWMKTIELNSCTASFITYDDARGTALLNVTSTGKIVHNNKQFVESSVMLLEWTVHGKIKRCQCISTTRESFMEKYSTQAQKNLFAMFVKFFSQDKLELVEDSPVLDHFSENIVMNVNMFPNYLAKSTFVGKSEMIDACKQMRELFGDSEMIKALMAFIKVEPIASDEKNVFLKVQTKKRDSLIEIAHYRFDDDNKLVEVNVHLPATIFPWLVSPASLRKYIATHDEAEIFV